MTKIDWSGLYRNTMLLTAGFLLGDCEAINARRHDEPSNLEYSLRTERPVGAPVLACGDKEFPYLRVNDTKGKENYFMIRHDSAGIPLVERVLKKPVCPYEPK